MPVSEAKKRANAKWDKEHMTCVTVRVTKKLAKEFADACFLIGRTRGEVLREAIDNIIMTSRLKMQLHPKK